MSFRAKRALTAIAMAVATIPAAERLGAQTQLISNNFFPAELEFKELQKIRSEKVGESDSVFSDLKEAPLIAEAGLVHYARRDYAAAAGSDVTIEVLTARDEKSALSLLTLLRNAGIQPGPPGDFFAASNQELCFARGAYWVRIRKDDAPELLRRIAISVSNRIGPREKATPSLASRMPKSGLDLSSLRYFLGPIALESFGADILSNRPHFGPEIEIAQARYAQGSQSGTFSLIGFPTSQSAESYFDGLSLPDAPGVPKGAIRSYAKRAGPLVGILQGSFEPAVADQILRPLRFSYSIRWIYDKNSRSSATVWGVPVAILGTVVRSLLLTALLCIFSLLLGASLATFRVWLRGYAPNNLLDRPERTELIRLRLSDGPPQSRSSTSLSGTERNP